MPRRATLVIAGLVPVLALAACGSGAEGGDQAQPGQTGSTPAPAFTIVTGVYPLEWAAQRIGGDLVTVVNLTPPGAEPHDLELTPQDVAKVASADLVIYEQGLAPALDAAVDAQLGGSQGEKVLEVSQLADLLPVQGQTIGGDAHTADDGHDHGADAKDPHFWLDADRFQNVARGITAQLGSRDQVNKQAYDGNFSSLSRELTTLDGDFSAGLHSCENTSIVTAHAAFGYLAARYGLNQVAITGITPKVSPTRPGSRRSATTSGPTTSRPSTPSR